MYITAYRGVSTVVRTHVKYCSTHSIKFRSMIVVTVVLHFVIFLCPDCASTMKHS